MPFEATHSTALKNSERQPIANMGQPDAFHDAGTTLPRPARRLAKPDGMAIRVFFESRLTAGPGVVGATVSTSRDRVNQLMAQKNHRTHGLQRAQ